MEKEMMIREYRDMLRDKQSELIGQEKVLEDVNRRFRASEYPEVEKEIRITIRETSMEMRKLEEEIMELENNINDKDVAYFGEEDKTSPSKVKKEKRVIFGITAMVVMVIILVGVTFMRNFL